MRTFAWLLLGQMLLLASPVLADGPRLDLDPRRGVVLTALPPILAEEEVQRHLTTGLTTTFLFRLEPRPREAVTGARIEVRYELWDEVFEVAVLTADGRTEQAALPDVEELGSWWQRLRLVVIRPEAVEGFEGAIRIVLDVIPFSQAERDDTERWFSETIGAASRGGAEEADRSVDDREESLGRVLAVLIATSIQRRALTSYHWTLRNPAEPQP